MTDSSQVYKPDSAVPDELVITHLHMPRIEDFRPAYVARPDMQIIHVTRPDVRYYRFLYGSVGEIWRWRDRLVMSDDDLATLLSSPTNAVYVLHIDGVPAGYVELETADGVSKIAYLGLRPEYLGMGLGKHLLSVGIARAWAGDTRRVTVQTCNLDAASALDNYLKRGFSIERIESQPMPARYAVDLDSLEPLT